LETTVDNATYMKNRVIKTLSLARLNSSGLGLTICKRIVERHGGKIWAESPGKGMGTTSYFTLQSGEV